MRRPKKERRATRAVTHGLRAIRENYCAYYALPSALRACRSFAVQAIHANPYVYVALPESLRSSVTIICETVARLGTMLAYVPDFARRSLLVVRTALASHGASLRFARVAVSRKLAELAVRSSKEALLSVPKELVDADLVRVALRHDDCCAVLPFLYDVFGASIDRSLVLDCISSFGYEACFLSELELQDATLLEAAIEAQPSLLQYVTRPEWWAVRPAVLERALALHGDLLCRAPDSVRRCRALVTAAVCCTPRSLAWAHESLRRDPEVVYTALYSNECAFPHVLPPLSHHPFVRALGCPFQTSAEQLATVRSLRDMVRASWDCATPQDMAVVHGVGTILPIFCKRCATKRLERDIEGLMRRIHAPATPFARRVLMRAFARDFC